MNTRLTIFALLLTGLLLTPVAHGDQMADLKQRFKDRYPVLLKLRTDGKAGEMYNGLTGAVKPEYQNDTVAEEGRPEPRTVKAFLAEENADRIALYKLIAEEAKTTAEAVAKHNAKRNFEKAKDAEYLKPSADAAWATKQALKDAAAKD